MSCRAREEVVVVVVELGGGLVVDDDDVDAVPGFEDCAVDGVVVLAVVVIWDEVVRAGMLVPECADLRAMIQFRGLVGGAGFGFCRMDL